MRVVVTGGRHYNDGEALCKVLNDLREPPGNKAKNGYVLAIAQGGCPTGADYLARRWAEYWTKRGFLGVSCVTYAADWRQWGRWAGPRRNQFMLDDFKPELVVACPGGRGTADCLDRARAAGIAIWHVRAKEGGDDE